MLDPDSRSGWGAAPCPPASSGALARPVQLPIHGVSARGRTRTADRHPGCWAQTAGPGGAILAHQLVSSGALARPGYLPTRDLSACGRIMTADRRPGCWVLAAGPVMAPLARRI